MAKIPDILKSTVSWPRAKPKLDKPVTATEIINNALSRVPTPVPQPIPEEPATRRRETFLGIDFISELCAPLWGRSPSMMVLDECVVHSTTMSVGSVSTAAENPVRVDMGAMRNMIDIFRSQEAIEAERQARHERYLNERMIAEQAAYYEREQRMRGRDRNRSVEIRATRSPLRDDTVVEAQLALGNGQHIVAQTRLEGGVIQRDFERGYAPADREIAHRLSRQLAEAIMPDILRGLHQLRTHRRVDNRDDFLAGQRAMYAHAYDIMTGGIHGAMTGRFVNKPEAENPIEKLADIETREVATTFEGINWTAKMLATEMEVWNEAEAMTHCLYKTYTRKMVEGDYVAFHIDAPKTKGFPKTGWTAGFNNMGSRERPVWMFDQVEGKARDRQHRNHPAIQHVIRTIESKLNKEPQSEQV